MSGVVGETPLLLLLTLLLLSLLSVLLSGKP
jgi:hypothetical protein